MTPLFSPSMAFLLLLRASLLSTGGFGNLPAVREDFVTLRGWATDGQVAASLAVGQVAPGPNGLWTISFGYLVDGVRGALLAALALTLPSLLVIPIARLWERSGDHPVAHDLTRGLGLGVTGLAAVILPRLLTSQPLDMLSLFLCVGALLLAGTKRVPVVVILAIAAVLGMIFSR